MITPADVDRLLEHPRAPGTEVVTVYLDVDQSRAANLNREFEVSLRTAVRRTAEQVPPSHRDAFSTAAARVLDFVEVYRPHARVLVVVCEEPDGPLWTGELHTVRLPTSVHHGDVPHLRPLLELMDDYERYGVILVDKGRARVFTVFLGEIEEERDAIATAEVRHKKSSGTDHLRSQMNFQRQDDGHVRWHLRDVAALVDEVARVRAFDRLVLAGPVVATSQLQRLLSSRLRDRVVGTVRLPFEASVDDVLRETLAVEQAAERSAEDECVEQLLTAAGKRDGGVTGLSPTLEALQERRVWRLVYADGWTSDGSECTVCWALFPARSGVCAYCGGALRAVDDLMDRALVRLAAGAGSLEKVHGQAAERLRAAGGGIGALLRF
jgi:peptide subunit release factor 1 (eRF1)